ncbi:hypothetical protein JM47_01030 [Ureaplasma diversum]|uniref:DNA 3'-5' helicase n=1 Tax=Ureaplasma diversum TaxID=42094 RepID=A0A0C5RLB2_9BACT|nr:ATP-dependent helicase [Ureaplasma diversum]AJQ45217.1 hypothetical protein JM47_01030 [Ureaplasma diversum]
MSTKIDYSKLNPEQKEAVTTPADAQVLVVAGAGTGKTSVLTQRIAYLIAELNFDPKKILGFTFTNKAADEMKERVKKTIPVSLPHLGTFHSICIKILRKEIHLLDYKQQFQIVDEDDQEVLVKEIIDELAYDKKEYKAKDLISLFSKLKSMQDYSGSLLDDQSNWIRFNIKSRNYARNLTKAFRLYNERLHRFNYLDFEDILNFTHKILSTNSEVLAHWQDQFDYILVDEFQDTNPIQYELVKLLANKHKRLFVVGDPDQMIYSFRGAKQSIINQFSSVYENALVIVLKTNYRSTQQILDAANQLINVNTRLIKKELVSFSGSGNKPKYHRADDSMKEASWVANEIKNLLNPNNNFNAKPQEIAVLYRSNYLSREIEQAIIREGINYNILGGYKFYQREEIKDIMAYLKVVNNFDELSLLRIVNKPRRGISNDCFSKLKKYSQEQEIEMVQVFEQIEQLTDFFGAAQIKAVKTFYDQILTIRIKNANQSFLDLIDLITETFKYKDFLETNYPDKYQDKIENIDSLKSAIDYFLNKNNDATLTDFINEVALYTAQDDTKIKEDAITLMTVHTSKGLEFDYVFIIGMNDDVFPSRRAIEEDYKALAEERRIAYVALTRARKQLYLSSSSGYSFVNKVNKTESRFIKEMGLNNLDIVKSNLITNKPASMSYSEYIKQEEERSWFDTQKRNEAIAANYYDDLENNYVVGEQIVHDVFGIGTVIDVIDDRIKIYFTKLNQSKELAYNHKSIKRKSA